jgi:chromosome partitioning protein
MTYNKMIGVVSGKGGVGKTAIVTNLAAELASDGNRVLIVDTDPQGTAALVFGLDQSPGVANVINGDDIVDHLVEIARDRWQLRPTGDAGALYILPGDYQTAAAGIELYVNGEPVEKLKQIFEPLIEHDIFDYIVFDTPPSVHPLAPYIYAAIGPAILPTDAGIEGLKGVFQTLTNVEVSGTKAQVILIVPDRIPHTTALHDKVISDLHQEFGHTVTPPMYTRSAWPNAAYLGQALRRAYPASVAAREWAYVYRAILRELRAIDKTREVTT